MRLPAAIASLLLPLAAAAGQRGLQHEVTFTAQSGLAGSAELMRRMLSPLAAYRLQQRLHSTHQALVAQSVDPSRERFALYVPARAPARGFGLLVFVPPWDDARVPQEWIPALDRHGMIFASAARSGNDADVLDRREPVALLSAYNVMRLYRIDPERVYIGGFSGGSRVALRIALAYPDVFRGALLEAGSDPIGSTGLPLPPAELFRRFQENSRIVYLTGENDAFHLAQDARSRDSLRTWCVTDAEDEVMPRSGHGLPGSGDFNRALNALERHPRPDARELATCRRRVGQAMDSQLRQVQALIGRRRNDEARRLLDRIDAKYGGLAAPRSVELLQEIDPSR